MGQGMGPTLNMASEMQGYTLTDRGTWLAYQNKVELGIAIEGDKRLFNPYQVILVNPKRYPDINYQGAKVFSDWLVNQKDKHSSIILSGKVNNFLLLMLSPLRIPSLLPIHKRL